LSSSAAQYGLPMPTQSELADAHTEPSRGECSLPRGYLGLKR